VIDFGKHSSNRGRISNKPGFKGVFTKSGL